MNKADTGYKMRLARVFEKALRTYGRTDGRTNGRMDGRTDGQKDRPSYRDARTHLKTDYNPNPTWN